MSSIDSNIQDYQREDPTGTRRNGAGNKASVMHIYSLGKAASNLQVGQTDLEVFPIEVKTYADGEITDNQSEVETKGVDGSGNNYSNNVTVSNSIKAKWLNRNAWLLTPGLVRRGEEVLIWRVGDSDQYYWELMGTTNSLRRRDVMLFVISNTDDESVEKLTHENSYFLEFNTVDKHITLNTPMNDGEACGYTIQLNTKDGMFSISDSLKNAIVLDSTKEIIQLINTSLSTVKLDRTKILIESREEVKIKTKSIVTESETTSMTQGKSFTSKAPKTEWSGDNFTGSYPTTNWSGSTIGFTYSTSTMNFGSGTTITGGRVNFNNSGITHNGKPIDSTHVHGGVQGGNSNTGSVS